MSGLDEILNIIGSQQKENEDRIISSAESKAREIQAEADARAEKAYSDYMKRAEAQHERNFENACSSADAAMKRRVLACKVELIDKAVENAIAKLRALPDKEYFSLLEKLIGERMREGEGVLSLGSTDLKRLPSGFEESISSLAAKKGGTVKLSREAAPIGDGFVLSYGLISENCSFKAIVEAEKEGIRDIAARELFG